MDTQAQQVVLHFSSRTHVTFSAAWSHPGLGQDSVVPPVYSVSQVRPRQSLAPWDLLIRAHQGEASRYLTYSICWFNDLISLYLAASSASQWSL